MSLHEPYDAFQLVRSHENIGLLEISNSSPTLIVFLRHSGCTFCRETLADLQRCREEIEHTGTALAVVHMSSQEEGAQMLKNYGLEKVHDFSDPQCILYRAFGLSRDKLLNLFSIPVVVRGLAAMLRGHGIGLLHGDGFRMPGVFVLAHGQIVAAHRFEAVSDRPDYVALASRGALLWHEQRDDGASRDETMITTS